MLFLMTLTRLLGLAAAALVHLGGARDRSRQYQRAADGTSKP